MQIGSSANSPESALNRFQTFNGWYQIRGFADDVFKSAPFIDDSVGLRILIKSRDPQLISLNALTYKDTLISTIPPGPLNSISPMTGLLADTGMLGGSLSNDQPSQLAKYVETGFGKTPELFKSKIVDQYTTEYIGSSITANWTVPGLGDCMGCDLTVAALVIQTKTSVHLFITNAMAEYLNEGH